eukprot:TRINITY_DN28751_c0_g1_i1.p1 TRINITY_DN28751_c0_g1~~TRINITY_DN28751_c0_g1_i1.p1  ORF type:complete len:395 (-),score=85.68 TRINITY_DN28751_c0_g1_i1:31-1164(-)
MADTTQREGTGDDEEEDLPAENGKKIHGIARGHLRWNAFIKALSSTSLNSISTVHSTRTLEMESGKAASTAARAEASSAMRHGTPDSRIMRAMKAAKIVFVARSASQEQVDFLQTFVNVVVEEAVHTSPPGGLRFTVSTDLESMEVSIASSKELMLRLANRFLAACKLPDLRLLDQMAQVSSVMKAPETWLWCRLKRIGRAQQSVDAGFFIDDTMEWMVADIVVPKSQDQEALRNYAMQDRLVPHGFASSLFPIEPEAMLSFQMDSGSLKSSIFTAFFLFKSMGFAKPEDEVLRAVTSVNALRCQCSASLGPKGLTQLAIRVISPRGEVAEQMAKASGFRYFFKQLAEVESEMGDAPMTVGYSAEMRGYTVSVTWAV